MLPKIIDPIQLCKQGVTLTGELRLEKFSRLHGLCDPDKQSISVALHFDRDNYGFSRIHGALTGGVDLCCQRCNQKLYLPLTENFYLSPVSSDEAAKRLKEPYEPLMITEDPVVLAELLEDELLLALPMAPKHEDCPL